MDNTGKAEQILAFIGGKENIVGVAACMTRLRITVKQQLPVKKDAIKKLADKSLWVRMLESMKF